jgi:type VI secretion system protein ImpK
MAEEQGTGRLALAFQELLTAIVRLRAGRQAVTDSESFRNQIRQALQMADQDGRRQGYSAEEIELASFAVVAFLDESILNARNAIFADWARKPFQEERFGTHTAGEDFFKYLQKLLGQNDSARLADLLEIFELCLLLGFGGRYSQSGRGELRGVIDQTGARIRRIRGASSGFSPSWRIPEEAAALPGADPAVKRLGFAAAGFLVLALALFAGYKLSLGAGASDIAAFATQTASSPARN